MEQSELIFETSKSTQKIDAAIFRIQNEAPVITKNGGNPHFRSKYAEYHDIQKAVKHLLLREKILVSFLPVAGNKLIMLVKDIDAAEFYKVIADLNTLQISPQAQGSAITYLKRYMFTAIFNLIIEDASDDDGNKSSIPQPGQIAQPQQQAATTSAAPAQPAVDLPYLNPDTEKWVEVKLWYFAKNKPLPKVTAKYRITVKNQTLLGEKEVLIPGSKLWNATTKYLAKKTETEPGVIDAVFDITHHDLQDLRVDAANLVKPAITQDQTHKGNQETQQFENH